IRGQLRSVVGSKNLKHAYIPDIPGREKRKRRASREGLIGVEGMARDVLIESLRRSGATFIGEDERQPDKGGITKADLYELGFTGGENSSYRRRELSEKLGLPAKMTSNALLEALNILYSRDEFYSLFR
ncbi:MAG: DUF4093 domain-containing protein, partial [Oscillospiraceae bacterium]|nr:DUF4093 domain-containing protein [Oscillospiraceae bacterium]